MNKKSSSAFAFNSGDFVVYPAHGVGKIADIAKQKIAGSELELIVVNFDKDKMTLRIPMAKAENIGLRKISGADTMNDALSVLKGKAKVKKIMWSRRAQEYENKSIPAIRLRLPKSSAICTAAKIWPNSLTASGRFMNRRWTGWQTRLQSVKIFLQPMQPKSCLTFWQNRLCGILH